MGHTRQVLGGGQSVHALQSLGFVGQGLSLEPLPPAGNHVTLCK